MTDTDKLGCAMVAECMAAYGVKHVVTSPGSRNAPLIMAFSRRERFCTQPVIDERCAAFIALGMAEITGEPVALVCTSGTALLNYAPAVAEAYYRNLPLVVISADRPLEWIDQNDSQTIRQLGALSNIVRKSIGITGELRDGNELWHANRQLNEAMHACLYGARGPVHINVSLSMPLTDGRPYDGDCFHKIEMLGCSASVDTDTARRLAAEVYGRRVMIVGTIYGPEAKLNKAFAQMSSLPGVVVIAEGLANIHAKGIHSECDLLFSGEIDDETVERLNPEILIAFGGAAVSARLKHFLRRLHPLQSWYVAQSDHVIDCYQSVTGRVDVTPEGFFPRFCAALAHLHRVNGRPSDYARVWNEFAEMRKRAAEAAAGIWCAPVAVDDVLGVIPADWNVQLSNGMSVRYALASRNLSRFHRVDSNRGVSGIDGSVSTAAGASAVYSRPTVLITGDMSMQYDMGALASGIVSSRLKIVVLNNGGGGIFKFVNTTRHLPECEHYFSCGTNLPLEHMASAYGFCYMRVENMSDLRRCVRRLIFENERPVILEIVTDAETDAEIFRSILEGRS